MSATAQATKINLVGGPACGFWIPQKKFQLPPKGNLLRVRWIAENRPPEELLYQIESAHSAIFYRSYGSCK